MNATTKSKMVNIKRTAKYKDNLDFYPTPPWATRALFKHVLPHRIKPKGLVLEPACGNDDMAQTIREYGKLHCVSRDIIKGQDFFDSRYDNDSFPWVITNPPYSFNTSFALRAIKMATEGVALFTRFNFLESQKRWAALLKPYPPTLIGQFVERVSMTQGKVIRSGQSAVPYCWVVWVKEDLDDFNTNTKFVWIPPCKRQLEKESDYVPREPLDLED